MSNCAMNNETDLGWLARNVHVWPEGKREALVCRPRNVDTLIWSRISSNVGWITKDQWLARRAELQNKPSWGSVGIEINFISQHEDGQWIGHSEKPKEGSECFECNCIVSLFGYGEVLGDWRDTLEKRPEEFQTFTSIEDNQEKAMKQDNGWHERGELPPVGVECDIRHSCWNSEKYEKVTVAAITNEYLIVKYATFEQHYMLKDISFRPIRTERDELIEIISSSLLVTTEQVADAILAAGFSRRDK